MITLNVNSLENAEIFWKELGLEEEIALNETVFSFSHRSDLSRGLRSHNCSLSLSFRLFPFSDFSFYSKA
ncbi:hypothetical protein LLA22_01455 [Lactococcus cremoris]|uniref:hypothetical protein n=1 Tax=Lactococcus lactis subsp. cremoris TaxID=1359 RepID=UPI0037C15399